MNSDGYTYLIQVDTNGNTVLPQLAKNSDKVDVSLRKTGKNANKSFLGLNKSAQGADKSVRSLGNTANRSFASLRQGASNTGLGKVNSMAQKVGAGLRRMTSVAKTGIAKVRVKAQQLAKSIYKIGTSSGVGFGKLNRNANQSRSTLSRLRGMAAGVGLTMSVGMAAGAVIGTGAGFEKSMSNVKALSQATNTEMASLTAAAREAGSATTFSARQSADAMGFLALAGYDATQQIAALPATLNLAATGGIELARSADIATNILSQYRMKASDTGVVVDQLAFTQSKFNTNIEEMSEAMTYLGPAFAAMNIGLSESNTVIGLLADSGLKGGIATRALASSIIRLSKPSSEASKAMKQLKVDFFDAQGQFVGVANMVDKLDTAMEGLSPKQKSAAVSTIFGNEAFKQMSILLNKGAEEIRYWTDELDNAEGTARRMADVKLDNLAGDFTMLKSVSEEFSLSLYDQFGPALRAITKEATLFVGSLDTKQVGLMLRNTILDIRKGVVWIGKHKGMIVNLGKAMIILKGVTIAYSVGLRASSAITAMATLAKWNLVAATRGATVATRVFNVAVKANPLGLFLGVLTAVIGAVTLFKTETKEAADAQGDLNQATLQYKVLKDETKDVAEQTVLDKSKLTKKQDPRQIKKVKEAALQRSYKIEDMIVDLKARAKTSPEYTEYTRLKQKRNESIKYTAGGVPVSTQSAQDKQRMIELESKINSMAESQTGLTLSALTNLSKANKALVKKATSLLPKEPKVDPNGLNNGIVPSTVVDDNMTENVISGGQRQTTINITVEKFQDSVNFNIQGQVDELRDSVEDMRAMVNEQFMRILNSANQLANG